MGDNGKLVGEEPFPKGGQDHKVCSRYRVAISDGGWGRIIHNYLVSIEILYLPDLLAQSRHL